MNERIGITCADVTGSSPSMKALQAISARPAVMSPASVFTVTLPPALEIARARVFSCSRAPPLPPPAPVPTTYLSGLMWPVPASWVPP
jgi:hypothetical protein